MRSEIAEVPEGEYFALNSYEVANRLSYLLWGSMPDDTLFAAAAANQLSTKAQILAQAQRMLADPRARANAAAFHREYTHMGPGSRWEDITRDEETYPLFSEAQVPLMAQETQQFFDYVVFDLGGSFQDLLTSPIGFVNRDLAPLYGLDPAAFGADLVPTDLDPTTRPGAFTRVGFLTAYRARTQPFRLRPTAWHDADRTPPRRRVGVHAAQEYLPCGKYPPCGSKMTRARIR
jgi:hypothetical protein